MADPASRLARRQDAVTVSPTHLIHDRVDISVFPVTTNTLTGQPMCTTPGLLAAGSLPACQGCREPGQCERMTPDRTPLGCSRGTSSACGLKIDKTLSARREFDDRAAVADP